MNDTDQTTTPRVMLTPEQAADAIGVGRTTLFALIKSGDIDSVRIGHLRRIPADAIEAYAQRLITEQTHEGA
jgi:excisionase family DNA binding protein